MEDKTVIGHGPRLPPEYNYPDSALPQPCTIFWLRSSPLGYNYYIYIEWLNIRRWNFCGWLLIHRNVNSKPMKMKCIQ